jgi:ectoine hydroxylase-related dioxygenase (phytanoyl-CoA dioxygenase family)
MRRVFKSDELQEEFDLHGYVVVPFLNEQQIEEIKKIYSDTKTDNKDAFYLSIWKDDPVYKDNVHKSVVDVVRSRAADYLDNYKFIVTNFAVKNSGQKSEFDWHQGINFTYEPQFVSITIWIPLQDVNEQNGNMQVVKGSHRLFNQDVRGHHYLSPFRDIKPLLTSKYTTNLPMKAGEAWIFNHRLVHKSPDNLTDKPRIAVLNALQPSEAPAIVYYKDEIEKANTRIEILEFTEENYHLQNVYRRPDVSGVISKGFTDTVDDYQTPESFEKLYKEKYLNKLANAFTG